jgi:type II secretory pathway pseudopilin PulG
MDQTGSRAFSLVEVVLALGICAFVLVALLGLFTAGLRAGRESEEQVQAANLASQIFSTRLAAPTNDTRTPGFAISSAALTNAYGPVFGNAGGFVGLDGKTKPSADGAAYRILASAGTNALTGPRTAQVYLMLSWPPQAALSNSAGHYETLTYIPLY